MASRQVKPRVVDDNAIEKETHLVSDGCESDDLDYIPREERIRGHDLDQLEYCHHCMQLKQT
jgi:hypothetical protein